MAGQDYSIVQAGKQNSGRQGEEEDHTLLYMWLWGLNVWPGCSWPPDMIQQSRVCFVCIPSLQVAGAHNGKAQAGLPGIWKRPARLPLAASQTPESRWTWCCTRNTKLVSYCGENGISSCTSEICLNPRISSTSYRYCGHCRIYTNISFLWSVPSQQVLQQRTGLLMCVVGYIEAAIGTSIHPLAAFAD